MSEVSDRPVAETARSGAHRFARLDSEVGNARREAAMVRLHAAAPAADAPGTPQPKPVTGSRPAAAGPSATPGAGEVSPIETVTLNKLGDFLELDFGRLFTWMSRGKKLAISLAVLGAIAGGLYGVFGTPKFTVGTDVMIDPANLQVVSDDLFQQPGQADAALLRAGSKLRVMTSGNVLLRVVDELNLSADKEFYNPNPAFSLSALLPFGALAGNDKIPPDPRLAALAALEKKIGTKADEKSFVATLTVSSENPQKSVRIAEAIVASFQHELATAEAAGASRTAEALNQRLDELKASVKEAEEKVEAYKRAHNLAASSGELVSNQTLTQLNAQVVEAQSRVISAQSAYDELLAAGSSASTADTQASATLTALRSRISDLRSQFNSQSMIYGSRHPTIVKLSTELQVAESELNAEIGRIVAAAKVTLDEATSGLAALTSKVNDLKTSVFADNEALVALRELERDAASKTTIYEAFLSRAKEVAEREQIDTTNVRVISPAVPPAERSWPPKTVVMLVAGAVAGLAFGMMIAVLLGIWRDLKRPANQRKAALGAA
jgi:uncharacterized protein involved in exopolysaccharide biosynthesis